MSDLFELFPTPVHRTRGLLDRELIRVLLDDLAKARKTSNAKSGELAHTGMIDPESGGITKRVSDLVTPKLAEFGSLLFGEALRWSIKEMWSNVLETGGHQSVHAHANSFISGIIYLTQSHPSANTVFVKAVGGSDYMFSNTHKAAKLGKFNAGKWQLPEAGAGDLVLFPSYLLHEVPRNQGPQRVSIAFNAIPDRLNSWGYVVRFSK